MLPLTPLKRLQHHQRRWQGLFASASFLINEVGERLLERLDLIMLDPAYILDIQAIIGCRSNELLKRYPDATVLVSRINSNIRSRARYFWQRWSSHEQALVADPHYLPLPDESVDFIFSNCFFFSSWDMTKLVSEWQRVLKPNGLVLFSTFGPDTLKEWRASVAQTSGVAEHNPFVDMHDIGDGLLHQGFSDPVMDMELLTIYYSSFKALCQDVRINNVSADASKPPVFHGKKYWDTLKANYSVDAVTNKLPVTCEIIYGHAWKLAKVPDNTPSEFAIPINRIRRAR